MGLTCKVVRGVSAFAPCLEHVRAGGGGGSVANTLFHVYVGVGNYTLPLDHSVLVWSEICQLGHHGDMWDYVWPTCRSGDITCFGWAL